MRLIPHMWSGHSANNLPARPTAATAAALRSRPRDISCRRLRPHLRQRPAAPLVTVTAAHSPSSSRRRSQGTHSSSSSSSIAMVAPRPALLVLAALLMCAVVAAPSGSTLTKAQLRAKFMENLHRFQAFPCRKPQRRSVNVGDLLLREGQLSPSQTIVPPATVLHLCGPTTGCCFSSDTVCSPLETQTVSLLFQVQNTLQRSEDIEMSINFVNHTRCGCVARAEANNTEVVVWDTNSVS